jgi:hypothetical protein
MILNRHRTHLNKHGVECVLVETEKGFGKVPLCCIVCDYFTFPETGEYGSVYGGPDCEKFLFFPTKKGSCKRQKLLEFLWAGWLLARQHQHAGKYVGDDPMMINFA